MGRIPPFLVQILLSLGSFETEYELMLSGSLKKAYELAQLYDPSRPNESVDQLLRLYVMKQLRTYPGSHHQFDRNLVLADSLFRELLIGDHENNQGVPSVLHTHIQEETTALGVPCITMRENTERPITVEQGTNTIVGVDPELIISTFNDVVANGGKAGNQPELWDGHAADRIVKDMVNWLKMACSCIS